MLKVNFIDQKTVEAILASILELVHRCRKRQEQYLETAVTMTVRPPFCDNKRHLF